jgi:ribonuclease HI
MAESRIIIYCDGACSGNQSTKNIGGWGAVMKYSDMTKELHGGERNTSNQRMELTACIRALESVEANGIPIDIYSDSAYLVNCMLQKWHVNWKKNGWKNAKKQPVENQDLWKRILELIEHHVIRFHKVVGHSGVELNERADQLAQMGIQEVNS